jgi:uncharacterized membrane protein YkoI
MRAVPLLVLTSLASVSMSNVATAETPVKVGVEVCANTALAKYPSQNPRELLQAVLKKEKSGHVWELEIQQKDKLVEVECSAETGEIVEIETRVTSPDDAPFKSRAKISEQQARKVALDQFPGTVERVEYEIESDGKVSYEFDIATDKEDQRVEVDGESGKVVESSTELLEIGRLPSANHAK